MVKQKTQERPKTSKSPKLKVTDETQCVLVTIEQGRFCEHGINGKHSKRGDYESPTYNKCTKRTVLSNEAVRYFISDDANCLRGKGQSTWKSMSSIQRLEANLALNAGGKQFTYEILN